MTCAAGPVLKMSELIPAESFQIFSEPQRLLQVHRKPASEGGPSGNPNRLTFVASLAWRRKPAWQARSGNLLHGNSIMVNHWNFQLLHQRPVWKAQSGNLLRGNSSHRNFHASWGRHQRPVLQGSLSGNYSSIGNSLRRQASASLQRRLETAVERGQTGQTPESASDWMTENHPPLIHDSVYHLLHILRSVSKQFIEHIHTLTTTNAHYT